MAQNVEKSFGSFTSSQNTFNNVIGGCQKCFTNLSIGNQINNSNYFSTKGEIDLAAAKTTASGACCSVDNAFVKECPFDGCTVDGITTPCSSDNTGSNGGWPTLCNIDHCGWDVQFNSTDWTHWNLHIGFCFTKETGGPCPFDSSSPAHCLLDAGLWHCPTDRGGICAIDLGLFHCPFDCSHDCIVDCPLDCSHDCIVDCPLDCSHDCIVDCPLDCSHDCIIDCPWDCHSDCGIDW